MQYRTKDYKPGKHDRFKALTLKQPWPDKILTGQKTIEVRNRKTSYRGELIITSSKNPNVERSGYTICKVDLVDVMMFSDLTIEQKYNTAIPKEKWPKYEGYYAWILRNPRPVVSLPIKGQMGIWNLVLDRGELTEDYSKTEFNSEYDFDREYPEISDKFLRNLRYMFYATVIVIIAALAVIVYLIIK